MYCIYIYSNCIFIILQLIFFILYTYIYTYIYFCLFVFLKANVNLMSLVEFSVANIFFTRCCSQKFMKLIEFQRECIWRNIKSEKNIILSWKTWFHHFYVTRSTKFVLYRIDVSHWREYRSHFICDSQIHARDLHFCTILIFFLFFFWRIYFLEDVASEIFQGLISLGTALLIQDWEMLHSLLKLFECDSGVSQLHKMQDVAKCRAELVNFLWINLQIVLAVKRIAIIPMSRVNNFFF